MSDDKASSSKSRASTSKRYNHNYLERKRRNNLKESFAQLDEALPPVEIRKNEKPPRKSRVQILKNTAEFITSCKGRKMDARGVNKIKAKEADLLNMISAISLAADSEDFEAAEPFVNAFLRRRKNGESFLPSPAKCEEEEEEEESTDSDSSESTDGDDSDKSVDIR